MNAAGMRFCITCGSPLDPSKLQPAPAPPAPVQGSAAPLPLVSPAAPGRAQAGTQPIAVHAPAAPAVPIAPIPVVGLGAPAAAPAKAPRICGRCRGACEGDAQFCRFCGAPLDAQAAPVAPTVAIAPPDPPKLDRTVLSPEAPAPEPVTRRDEKSKLETTAKIEAYQSDAAPGPRIFLVSKEGALGPSHPIGDQLDIGRTEGDLLLPDDRYLSARHARIRRGKDGGLLLRDLGTPNGVFLRLHAQRPQGAAPDPGAEMELRDGDLILIGQQVLRFEVVKDADEGFGAASEHGTLLFGTPAAPRYARLGQVTTEGAVRDVHHLHKAETVLGRESGDIVFTEDPFLSRRHAVIRMRAGDRRFSLSDLDSSNGTFLRVRGEVAVGHGDEIRIGQQLFRVDASTAPGAKGTA